MAQQWDADVELGDIISFALDFKKLQKILKGLLTGMDGMRLDITNLQDQQGKWEETLLGKVNALEKQVLIYCNKMHCRFATVILIYKINKIDFTLK